MIVKLKREEIKELRDFLKLRRKRLAACEVLTSRYVFIPFLMAFIYIVDDPNIQITKTLKNILIKLAF